MNKIIKKFNFKNEGKNTYKKFINKNGRIMCNTNNRGR